MPRFTTTSLLAAFVTLLAAGACEGDPNGAGRPAPAVRSDTSQAPQPPQRAYERAVVFVSTTGDSLFVVPWIMEAYSRPGGVTRIARGWLARSSLWEAFMRDAWESPPNREPWRILPHGPLRILVGEGDRLDRIVYEGGSRRLEVSLNENLVEWTGNLGTSFDVLEGGLVLGDRRVPGQVLEVAQGFRPQDGVPGDWMFLTSGDSVSLVVHAPLHGEEPSYQGWARAGIQDYQWPEVEVTWTESRAYEPARRDIPSVVALGTPEGDLEGEIRVLNIQVETRDGAGPVLPVDGILDVEGTLLLAGRPLPVRGILRHRQP